MVMKNNIKTRKQKLLTLLNEAIDDNQDYAVDCLLELKEEDEDFERELRDYISFVDRAKRTHGLIEGEPIEIKYKIYKEFLGEK